MIANLTSISPIYLHNKLGLTVLAEVRLRSGAAGFLGVTTTGHSVQDLHGPSDRVFDVGQGAGMLRGARAGTGRGG